MKRYIFIAGVSLILAACSGKPELKLVDAAAFDGQVDGKPVALYTLKNGDITLQATNFGARVVSIYTPDKAGNMTDIVLGHNTLDEYVHPAGERFFGACVGPVANRIGGAQFNIGDTVYETPKNDNGVNTLHGGFKGLDNLVWDVTAHTDSTLSLHLLHPDGLEGYPGNLDIDMVYTLTRNNEFRIDYSATTDAATPVNISSHPFFVLGGEGAGSCEKWQMQINASNYVPIDSLSIPLGGTADVSGTPFDFRKIHSIGQRIGDNNRQLAYAHGYDHNWCIDKTTDGVEHVCTLRDPVSRRQIDVYSDQPGLQIYTGNFFTGTPIGKTGKPIDFRCCVAIETQHYPDSPNRPEYPSILLEPEQIYTHTCIYRFSVHTPSVDKDFKTR